MRGEATVADPKMGVGLKGTGEEEERPSLEASYNKRAPPTPPRPELGGDSVKRTSSFSRRQNKITQGRL